MKISSPEFDYGTTIPIRYSREGGDYIPPLVLEELPPSTEAIVIIVEDPDAPGGLFTHCVIYNLDPAIETVDEAHREIFRFGLNSWGEANYGGPKPPDGEHRYFFRAYALDRALSLLDEPAREDVEGAMEGRILDQAEWMGRFAAAA